MGTFVEEFSDEDMKNSKKMEAFQHRMDEAAEVNNAECDKMSQEFGISDAFASAIQYLRTRSRWTQGLEDELILMGKAGKTCPNMNEWP